LNHGCERRIELAFIASAEDVHLLPEGTGSHLRGAHLDFGVRIVRIHEISDGGGIRHEIVHQLQSLSDRGATKYGDTGRVAGRPVEARDQAFPDGVAVGSEHDRNRLGCRLSGLWRRLATSCGDHRHLTANQIGCQLWQTVKMAFGPSILDCDVPALNVTNLVQS